MIDSLSRAGQAAFVHRVTASPLGRAVSEPQTGQRSGIRNFLSSPVRFSRDHPHDFRDHIPALWITTVSPMRTSFGSISSWLWSVALLTVTPPT